MRFGVAFSGIPLIEQPHPVNRKMYAQRVKQLIKFRGAIAKIFSDY
jgi:hypothetical protein